MVEATNFVEKTLGKSLDPEKNIETPAAAKESVPVYTPPPQPRQEFIPPQPQILQPPVIQIIEKIVYKKQRIHGFFRTLTIIALLAIGFLMLGESTGIVELSVNTFKLHQVFPIIIILSSLIIRSYKWLFGKLFWLIIFLGVWGWMFTVSIYTWLNPSSKRTSGETIKYSIPELQSGTTNLYIQTLVGNSEIRGNKKNDSIAWTRNSDRNLLVASGNNGNVAYLKLQEDSNRNILHNNASKMDLTLPDKQTFDLLYIKNLLWQQTIDLSTFQRKMLKFHAGIDDVTIKIGNVLSGNKIEIQGTAANIQLDIPKDVGVLMYYKHLVGMINIPDFDALSGHYFQSKNIATAKTMVNMYINIGIGNTKINRVDAK